MTVSSTSNTADIQVNTMKKATDTQEQQITQLLDANQKQMQQQTQQQNQQMAAQKTGIGSNLNILG